MTNKIIEAAIEAAGQPPGTVLPTQLDQKVLTWLERFYDIVRAEALEDAAKVCDALKEKALTAQSQKSIDDPIDTNLRMIAYLGNEACAEAIRKLKEQQHG